MKEVDAKVMLSKNFLVELGLMNGAVGTVHVHEIPVTRVEMAHMFMVMVKITRIRNSTQTQLSIVGGFPESDIPETDKFFCVPDLPRTCMHPHTNANGGGET